MSISSRSQSGRPAVYADRRHFGNTTPVRQKKRMPGWVLLLMLSLLLFLYYRNVPADRASAASSDGMTPPASADEYVVMCYNVENLFDTEDDPRTSDNEFTPSGTNHWTMSHYWEKLQHLYEVIAHVGGWSAPAIVGMTEIENRAVLEALMEDTPLKRAGYAAVHYDSPDPRGIDVALLYRTDLVRVLNSSALPVRFDGQPDRRTRDILHVEALLGTDTVHFFVNHWPSRGGGERESAPLRQQAARTLRRAVDAVLRDDRSARILIMGDFNDTPDDLSVIRYLRAEQRFDGLQPGALFNLTCELRRTEKGSYKYQGQWDFLDQMIVSEGFLNAPSGLFVRPDAMRLFSPDYLLEDDRSYLGKKPFRMYQGPQYHGGYSDHLPVYVRLERRAVR
ncbi:MAG: endonuclease/exonuclease/phosphatase family protein [Bacteroidales bacterium]|nr:endonuclease/exonuclease/phosphatase family protein [Bacteroidales bacterium]